jgi:hypothetical protein
MSFKEYTADSERDGPRFFRTNRAVVCPECQLSFYQETSGNVVNVWVDPDNNLSPGEWNATKTKIDQVSQTSKI